MFAFCSFLRDMGELVATNHISTGIDARIQKSKLALTSIGSISPCCIQIDGHWAAAQLSRLKFYQHNFLPTCPRGTFFAISDFNRPT